MASLLVRTLFVRRLSSGAPTVAAPSVSDAGTTPALLFCIWCAGVAFSLSLFSDAGADKPEALCSALVWPVSVPYCAWEARQRRLAGRR